MQGIKNIYCTITYKTFNRITSSVISVSNNTACLISTKQSDWLNCRRRFDCSVRNGIPSCSGCVLQYTEMCLFCAERKQLSIPCLIFVKYSKVNFMSFFAPCIVTKLYNTNQRSAHSKAITLLEKFYGSKNLGTGVVYIACT